MSPFVLSVLKYSLLALVYLFIWRTVRTVLLDLRVPSEAEAPSTRPTRARKEARAPTSVLVRSAEGKKLGSRKLAGPIQIGRAASCDLRLQDTYVSQVHARIFTRDGSWYVEDLGSTNGTFVNEERISAPAPVRAGDRVRVGTTVIELRR